MSQFQMLNNFINLIKLCIESHSQVVIKKYIQTRQKNYKLETFVFVKLLMCGFTLKSKKINYNLIDENFILLLNC